MEARSLCVCVKHSSGMAEALKPTPLCLQFYTEAGFCCLGNAICKGTPLTDQSGALLLLLLLLLLVYAILSDFELFFFFAKHFHINRPHK